MTSRRYVRPKPKTSWFRVTSSKFLGRVGRPLLKVARNPYLNNLAPFSAFFFKISKKLGPEVFPRWGRITRKKMIICSDIQLMVYVGCSSIIRKILEVLFRLNMSFDIFLMMAEKNQH